MSKLRSVATSIWSDPFIEDCSVSEKLLFIYLLTKDYPGDLWRSYWKAIVRAQFRITIDALRAWRGPASRARLRGQIAGLLGIPKMLRKRRKVQQSRTVDELYLRSILSNGE